MRLVGLVLIAVLLVAIMVLPPDIAVGLGAANPIRHLPATVERGATFNVTVNFTAPGDNFIASSLSDFAPTGWNVTVNGAWCQPQAQVKATGNQAEFGWKDPYGNGTNFTVPYKVTVPCDAELGNYSFDGFLMYYVGGNTTHIYESITGDFNVTVVRPAICFAPEPINFYASAGGANPPNQTAELWSSTPCLLNWSLTDDADWLSENRTSGNCTNVHSSVALSVNSSGMSLGEHLANITINSTEANNSPHIVNVILHITLTGTLQGQVNFTTSRGAPGTDRWVEPFVVKLFQPGNFNNVLWAGNATTNNTGVFTITDVVATTYDIGIKNCTCLSKVVTNVTVINGNITVVNFGTLREGDSNNDDYITISDRTLLYGGWGTGEGDPGWRPNCDFNRDGYLTVADRTLMYVNWGQKGDLAP